MYFITIHAVRVKSNESNENAAEQVYFHYSSKTGARISYHKKTENTEVVTYDRGSNIHYS